MILIKLKVGPAVFNGGLSTLLAFILLSTSRSYVFLSFFKVCLFSYLIFVIFFTRAKFLENKIYTEKRQFFALNL